MRFILFLVIFFITSCDSSKKIESMKIGSEETKFLEIKHFPDNLKAKNVIFVVGDGAGFSQVTLSRIVIGGLDYRLAIDQLPIQGASLTHPFGNVVTDSAAAGTAWATGNKTKNRYLSVDPNKDNLKTLPEILSEKGYLSGLVATSSITHATPAAFYAHIDSRYKEIEIANQLLESPIKVALGGGKEFFDLDKVNAEHTLLLSKTELKSINSKSKIIGLFDEDGIKRSPEKPTQLDMTKFALSHLEQSTKNCSGFFLMSEGSQIDWAGHSNDTNYLINEFIDFDNTIKDLINFVTIDENTLLIVTADHETGGLQVLKQEKGKIIIQWLNGKHTAQPVTVHAYGPGANLFTGLMDNTEIHNKILEIINYKNLKIASMPPPSSGGLLLGLMLNMLENFDLSDDPNDVKNILIISEIMQIAFSLRAKHIGDEDFYPVPIENFLSEDIATELSKNVNTKRTSKNSEINNANIIFKENTTHFSIIDKYGNAVSNTTTLNTGFGSGIVIKDTGILMNNEMDDFSSAPGVENYFSLLGSEANKIEPKKRPLSSMSPTIVFEDDEVRLITGAQGGGRIITAVLQIIINYFEYKLSPELSVSTNRYHHQWFPEKLYYENFDEKTLRELKKLGFELEKRELEDYYSNGITSTIIIEGDKIIGISDPRLDDYSSAGSSAD